MPKWAKSWYLILEGWIFSLGGKKVVLLGGIITKRGSKITGLNRKWGKKYFRPPPSYIKWGESESGNHHHSVLLFIVETKYKCSWHLIMFTVDSSL